MSRLCAPDFAISLRRQVTPDGTHPHQWTPPRNLDVYVGDWSSAKLKKKALNFECFICHNGDFDAFDVRNKIVHCPHDDFTNAHTFETDWRFFKMDGTTFELGTIQGWLPKVKVSTTTIKKRIKE